MGTITEDYVSFETAKLLKEKGMNKSCFKHYVQKNNDDGTSEAVTVCTLQRAMKWLREKYNIIISITPKRDKYYFTPLELWDSEWVHTKAILPLYDTYEEACEAAIKYCLEHLI